MYTLLRYLATSLLALALASRGVISAYASANDNVDDPVALVSRMTQVTEEESGDDDDDDDSPSSTDNDGFDTPTTDYDGIDTPETDNDGVDTPLSTDNDGVTTPYTDYDGIDSPSVPTLSVGAKSNSIELTWNAVAEADYFELYAWDNVEEFRQLGGDRLNATSITDSNVVSGRTYHYTIQAWSNDGRGSGWSSYVSARVGEASSTIDAPVLSAVPGVGQVELSWGSVSGAVRYDLWAREGANAWQYIGGNSLSATEFTHTALSDGVTYTYAIRAVSDSGETSPWSSYVKATTEGLISARQVVAPDTDYDGYSTPATDYDGIDTPTTDNDGIDTPLTTDNDGTFTPYTDYDGVDTTDNDGIDTTDGDGIDTTDNDGTDSDGIDTLTPTDNDGTDSDGIDTPTPTDNDGTDSDGIDTPTPSTPSTGSVSSASS